MIFSSLQFVLVFLPLTLLIFFILNRFLGREVGTWWLIAANFVFYACNGLFFLGIFLAILCWDYGISWLLGRPELLLKARLKKTLLVIGLAGNILALGYFKYTNFALSILGNLSGKTFDPLAIAWPVGISFYTFQLISYLVDSYRGETADYSFKDFLTFITFFPQLLVGPIVHHRDVYGQYASPSFGELNVRTFSRGIFRFAIGLFKKLVIADPLTALVQPGALDPGKLNTLDAWVVVLGYTVSYYFDLSGYADMAIGIGWMFNIHLPDNFDSPYKALDFVDYWRRWHITLSRFLNEYIFRSVYHKGDTSFRFYLGVLLTFMVSGIWHGAGWVFVLWGLVNALFVMAGHVMRRNGLKLPDLLAWPLTFAGILLTRALFISPSVGKAFTLIGRMFDRGRFSLHGNELFKPTAIILIITGLGLSLFAPNSKELMNRFRPSWFYGFATVGLFCLALVNIGGGGQFLYMKF